MDERAKSCQADGDLNGWFRAPRQKCPKRESSLPLRLFITWLWADEEDSCSRDAIRTADCRIVSRSQLADLSGMCWPQNATDACHGWTDRR